MSLASRRAQRLAKRSGVAVAAAQPEGRGRSSVAVAAASDADVRELRRLLSALLWGAPEEVEPEVQRTLADGAMAEALRCYRQAHAEYLSRGVLPCAA